MQVQNDVADALGCVAWLIILALLFAILKVSQHQSELYSHILTEISSIKLEISALRDQLRSNR